MTLFEFSRQIASLRSEKKHSEALAYFKENKVAFSKEQIAGSEYIISDIITCLRQTNQLDAGFKFINIYDINIGTQQKERVLTAYGWLLWTKYKAENRVVINSEYESLFFDEDDEDVISCNTSFDKNELAEKIEAIIPILSQTNSDFTNTLISNLFLIVLKSEKRKPAPNWRFVNDFCNKIDRYSLSKQCSTIQVERKGQLKDMELASDFENRYAYKTKSLMKLGEWQECFDIAKEALETVDVFHYSNDIWFSRRIALTKKNLGNTEDTIKELETILKKKKEWFIQKELAELYFERSDIDLSFKMAINAINNFGPLEFKVDLLFLLGKILKEQGYSDLAIKHFSLSKLIRQDEGWKIPKKIFDELNQCSDSVILLSNITDLKCELQRYWKSSILPQNENISNSKPEGTNLEGLIVKILHDNERGKDGFIKRGEINYYFSMSSNFHLFSNINLGVKVVFKVLTALDKEKREQAKIIKVLKIRP